jgi:hypothetical protein
MEHEHTYKNDSEIYAKYNTAPEHATSMLMARILLREHMDISQISRYHSIITFYAFTTYPPLVNIIEKSPKGFPKYCSG